MAEYYVNVNVSKLEEIKDEAKSTLNAYPYGAGDQHQISRKVEAESEKEAIDKVVALFQGE